MKKVNYQLLISKFLEDEIIFKNGGYIDHKRDSARFDMLMEKYADDYQDNWKIKAKEEYPEEFL